MMSPTSVARYRNRPTPLTPNRPPGRVAAFRLIITAHSFGVFFRTLRVALAVALVVLVAFSLTGQPVYAGMSVIVGTVLLTLSLIGGHR